MGQTNITPWVKGNTLPLAVPLRTKTAVNGAWVTEDYTPPADSDIHAFLVGKYKRYEYDFTLDGNIVKFTDDGSLPIGDYGVEITVKEPTDINRRTFKCQQLRIVNCTDEIGMLPDGEVLLDAAIFIKGEDGKDGKDGRDGVDGKDGKDGRDGSDADVTTENIVAALGYTPADSLQVEAQLATKMDAPTEEEFNGIFN